MKHLFARFIGALALGFVVSPAVTFAATAVTNAIEVFHDPACGCCINWIRYLQAQGYTVRRAWACPPAPRPVIPRESVAT